MFIDSTLYISPFSECMLEPDPFKRPDIYTVCDKAFAIRGMTCPVVNQKVWVHIIRYYIIPLFGYYLTSFLAISISYCRFLILLVVFVFIIVFSVLPYGMPYFAFQLLRLTSMYPQFDPQLIRQDLERTRSVAKTADNLAHGLVQTVVNVSKHSILSLTLSLYLVVNINVVWP